MISTTIMVCENSDSFYIGTWCNGNTTVFGAVITGSIPVVPTNRCFVFNLNSMVDC